MEETAIEVGAPDAALDPIYVREGRTLWKVYPFAYRVKDAEPVLNEENEDFRWVSPDDIQSLETVRDTERVVRLLLGRL